MDKPVFNYHMPMQVRFADLDMLGHVTNAVYAVYYNCAIFGYYRDVLNAGENFLIAEHNMVMATMKIDYIKSVLFEHNIRVDLRVATMGSSSFEIEMQIVEEDTGEVYSRCACTQVCYSRSKSKPILMPEVWRQRILAFEATPPLPKAKVKNG